MDHRIGKKRNDREEEKNGQGEKKETKGNVQGGKKETEKEDRIRRDKLLFRGLYHQGEKGKKRRRKESEGGPGELCLKRK
jgi:hypothetical protein